MFYTDGTIGTKHSFFFPSCIWEENFHISCAFLNTFLNMTYIIQSKTFLKYSFPSATWEGEKESNMFFY
jgi:hypothetical protein